MCEEEKISVYDLTVEDNHNFFANDILVHNCLGGIGTFTGFWEFIRDKTVTEQQVIENLTAMAEKMNSIFKDGFYLELQWNAIPEQHILNQMLIKVHEKTGIPLISTADCHFPDPKLWREREIYKKLAQLSKAKELTTEDIPKTLDEMPYQLFPKNGDQMFEHYKMYSKKCGVEYDDQMILESIERTYDIAHNVIEDVQPNTKIELPNCFTPAGMTSDDYLKQLCEKGLHEKGLDIKPEYVERLKYELDVISKRKMSDYFILMYEVRKVANTISVKSCGRGSISGSLIAYLIELSQLDPIKFGLYFERFIDVDGVDYPDIDTDFEDPGQLHEALQKEWGPKYGLDVVQVSNYNTFQLKNLVKDLSKLEGIPFQEVNDVTNKVYAEATKPAKLKHDIESGAYNPTLEDALEFSPSFRNFMNRYEQVGKYIEGFSGENRNISKHACARVIGKNLESRLPLVAVKGNLQTPFTEGQRLRELEPMGFLKYDFLGLATLRTISSCIKMILSKKLGREPKFSEVIDFYDTNLHADKIDLNDQKVYKEVFHAGKWIGIFQFAQRPVQEYCKKVQPRNIFELSDISATFRPGPLAAGVDKLYLENNLDNVDPKLKAIFGDTRGQLIYQEQITKAANVLSGMTLAQGNKLRKLIIKKGVDKSQIDSYKVKFFEGGKNNGIELHLLESVWRNFERAGAYSFVKAHSMAYCITSYQCAWLLTYFPEEWACSFLQKEPEDRKEQAIAIVKSHGFEIGDLDINESDPFQWTLKEGKIIPPLQSIKGLGESAINVIMENRPFLTLDSVVNNPNIEYRKLNKKGLDVLCRSGCLNKFLDSRFTGSKHLWATIQIFDRKSKKKTFDDFIKETEEFGEFTKKETLENKVELTGVYPIELIVEKNLLLKLADKGVPPVSEFDPDLQVAWLVPREIVAKKTGKGKDYYIVKCTDINSGLQEIKCWGVNAEKDILYTDRVYAVRLSLDDVWGFSTNGGLSNWRLLT